MEPIELNYSLTWREWANYQTFLFRSLGNWGIALAIIVAVGVVAIAALFLVSLVIVVFALVARTGAFGPLGDTRPLLDFGVANLETLLILPVGLWIVWLASRRVRITVDQAGIRKRSTFQGKRFAWERIEEVEQDDSSVYVRSRFTWTGRNLHAAIPKRVFSGPAEVAEFIEAIERGRAAGQQPSPSAPDVWPPAPTVK